MDQRNRREELLELYKLALEDYRFQVQLNQERMRYFLVLNLTVIGIATGVVQIGQGTISALVSLLYLGGFLFCVFSTAALRAQRKFYASARDQKEWFEDQLDLGASAINPAPHSRTKLGKMYTFKAFVTFMFVVMAALNLVGAGVVLLG